MIDEVTVYMRTVDWGKERQALLLGLRALMAKRGLSQLRLARALGRDSTSYVNAFLSARRRPSLGTLHRYVDALAALGFPAVAKVREVGEAKALELEEERVKRLARASAPRDPAAAAEETIRTVLSPNEVARLVPAVVHRLPRQMIRTIHEELGRRLGVQPLDEVRRLMGEMSAEDLAATERLAAQIRGPRVKMASKTKKAGTSSA